jgi:hypothetical protein
MEAAGSSDTLEKMYQTMCRHMSEGSNHPYRQNDLLKLTGVTGAMGQ